MVSFTAGPLYAWQKSIPYQLDRKLGVHHSQSGHCGVQKKSLVPAIFPCKGLDLMNIYVFFYSHNRIQLFLGLWATASWYFDTVNEITHKCTVNWMRQETHHTDRLGRGVRNNTVDRMAQSSY
jgi:hypothetical protein